GSISPADPLFPAPCRLSLSLLELDVPPDRRAHAGPRPASGGATRLGPRPGPGHRRQRRAPSRAGPRGGAGAHRGGHAARVARRAVPRGGSAGGGVGGFRPSAHALPRPLARPARAGPCPGAARAAGGSGPRVRAPARELAARRRRPPGPRRGAAPLRNRPPRHPL
ncbi:MAG: hypothetical protein AVDCRST_MAG40-3123, partial [uncultured Gemmatimonadaceae bacterium]